MSATDLFYGVLTFVGSVWVLIIALRLASDLIHRRPPRPLLPGRVRYIVFVTLAVVVTARSWGVVTSVAVFGGAVLVGAAGSLLYGWCQDRAARARVAKRRGGQ